jgi:hypothetical protein
MRTPHGTPNNALDTLHPALGTDAMRPWQAFGTPPAPAALDPRRWIGTVLTMVAGVAARVAAPRTTTRAPARGVAS